MFGFKLLGNTRIPHHKNTADMQPVRMAPPKEVLLPMAQHIGAPATPIVKVGDEVKVGQLIAEASGHVSAPIYASVSGKVTKLDSYLRHDGRTVPAIRIESDGLMTPADNIAPPTVTDLDSLIEAIGASGLVGLGGAGFPTAVKFDAIKEGKINTVVLNGAECEPYITSDARAMIDRSGLMREGIELLKKFVPEIKKYIFGIESNKQASIDELKRVFADDGAVEIKVLPSLYPQGAEKILVHNTTGRVIPAGKLPAEVGVVILNVTTLATLANYVKTGMPLVEKCITVDGSAIKHPKNVLCPIGTSIRDVLDFVDGERDEPGKVIFGGPMTGFPAYSLDEPIVKNTNAITVLTKKDAKEREATACIHCGRCVEACPLNLVPTAFTKALDIENVDERMARLEEYSIMLCMECGCCSFVCPANRPLIQNNRMAKNSLREYNSHRAKLK